MDITKPETFDNMVIAYGIVCVTAFIFNVCATVAYSMWLDEGITNTIQEMGYYIISLRIVLVLVNVLKTRSEK